MFKSFFYESDAWMLGAAIDKADWCMFVKSAYADFLLSPYEKKILVLIVRQLKKFAYETGGLGLINIATQYSEKVVAKVGDEIERHNNNDEDYLLRVSETLDILHWASILFEVADFGKCRKEALHRLTVWDDSLSRDNMRKLECMFTPEIRKFVGAVWEIDHKSGTLPETLLSVLRSSRANSNSDSNNRNNQSQSFNLLDQSNVKQSYLDEALRLQEEADIQDRNTMVRSSQRIAEREKKKTAGCERSDYCE